MTSAAPPLKIGVVGTGAIAQLIHLPLLIDRTDVEVVALADADELRAGELAKRFDVARVTEVELLIREEEVDGIILCTPNHLHESMAVAALEAGRHVLVERPLAMTPEGCREIVAAAEANDRVAMAGMSHRFRPDVAALRAFVAGGKLGQVYAGRAAWMNRALPLRRSGWRQDREQSGGGALMDLGVQAIDILLWMLGGERVQRVFALTTAGEHEVEDAATLMLETENGVALTVEVSWNFFASSDRHYARLLGTEGGGELPPLEICSQVGGRPMDVTPRPGSPEDDGTRFIRSYRRQHDHFLRMIRGHAPVVQPHDQIHVMEVVQAAYLSATEGREVRL